MEFKKLLILVLANGLCLDQTCHCYVASVSICALSTKFRTYSVQTCQKNESGIKYEQQSELLALFIIQQCFWLVLFVDFLILAEAMI